jgi:hypothetical protein
MKKYVLIALIALLIGCNNTTGESKVAEPESGLIQIISNLLLEKYYDKSIAEKISAQLILNDKNGVYDSIINEKLLISKINNDIHLIHNDRHIQLIKNTPSERIVWTKSPVAETKVLDGNIGYFKLLRFTDPNSGIYDVAAAFSLLKHTKGIIIDLRNNGGGPPDVASYILGYFNSNGIIYDVF